MCHVIKPLHDPPGLCVVFSGALTGADVRAAFEAVTEHLLQGAFRRPISLLWDARSVARLVMVPEDLPALYAALERMEQALQAGRTAILIRKGESDVYIMSKLLAARAPQGRRVRATFTDEHAALAWLSTEGAAAPMAGAEGRTNPRAAGAGL